MGSVCSHCLHSHLVPVGLTACEGLHGRCHWVSSHCLHTASGPVGLIGSEWFHGMHRGVCFHCFHSHSDPVCFIASEQFHLPSFIPTLFILTFVYWLDSEWVISCQVQLGLFSLPSFPLLFCWLDSKWVILWQIQLGLFSLSLLSYWFDRMWVISRLGHLVFSHCIVCIHSHFGSIGLKFVSDFMTGAVGSVLTTFTPTLVLLAWQEVSDFMVHAVVYVLTAFTLNLVILAWQQMSDFVAG